MMQRMMAPPANETASLPHVASSHLTFALSYWAALTTIVLYAATGCQSAPATTGPTTQAPAPPLQLIDISSRIAIERPRGRGVALVDFDGDQWPDITVSVQEGVLRFRNQGDGTFAPFGGLLALPFVQAVTWVDVDGDEDLDLYLTALGSEHRLYLNDGDGGLTDRTNASGIGAQEVGAQGATFADVDGDGDLDLYIATGPRPQDLRTGNEIPGTSGGQNRLYLNDGDGTFVLAAGIATGAERGESFQGAFYDYDDDGDLDLFVADDFAPDVLYENDGSGGFLDVSQERLPGNGLEDTSSMGLSIADIDGDGALDLYATQRNRDLLYRFTEDQDGLEDTFMRYLADGYDPTAQITGWGVALVDFDDDGDVDVLQTSNYETVFDPRSNAAALRTGWMVALENQIQDPPEALVDVSGAVGESFYRPIDGWGLAVGDIDKDGDQDVLIGVDGSASQGDPDAIQASLLLLNDGQRARDNASVRVRLRQTGKNPFAVGAKVTMVGRGIATTHLVAAGTGFLSQNEYVVHFGLGPYARAPAIEVRWPDGATTLYGPLEPGEHTLVRPISGGCCIFGTCQEGPRDACLSAMGSVNPSTAGCAAACEQLAACCGGGFPTAKCVEDCSRTPPPDEVLSCLENSACTDALECIGRRYLFIDGEVECRLEDAPVPR